jgi:hypothetical protein
MRRDLDRLLKAAETRRFVSERVAAILRAIDAMSDQELAEQIIAEPSGIFDPRTMTDAELDWLITEFETRAAAPRGTAAFSPRPATS